MEIDVTKLVLCLVLLFNSPVFGQSEQACEQPQQESVHSLGFGIGINEFHARDEYLSPYIFSGTMFTSMLSYQLKTEHFRHAIVATYSTGHPNSDIQPREVTERIGSLSYSLARTLDVEYVAGNPLEVSLGTGISSFASHTTFDAIDVTSNYAYLDRSWYWSHSLNLLFRGEYQFAGHSGLSLQVTMPVFRLVSRPANGHEFNEKNAEVIDDFLKAAGKGTSEFFWDNLVLMCEVGYTQRISDHLGFRAGFQFDYTSSDRPLPLGMYMNRLLIGLDWVM
jgi:hypothetical protein